MANTGWRDLLTEGRLPRFALIALGVWLNAADSLVTATIMPSVGRDLGGYQYFSWTVAGFLVGAIMAGASSGRLAEMFGLRRATTLAGLVFTAGCLIGASAPSMAWFVAGRIIQGLGSGWISGFAMVAVAMLFPPRHLARVFASTAAIWGIATLLGPLVGGAFAQAGNWRAVFWLFAAQSLVFTLAAPWLLTRTAKEQHAPGIPWRQLGVLGLGIAAIAIGDVARSASLAIALVIGGLAILALVLRIDHRSKVRLLPHRAGDLRTIVGSGYASLVALTAASMALTVYGPAILQQLHGLRPIAAGYAVAAEALLWTTAALLVAGVEGERGERRAIRAGAACVLAGVVGQALTMRAAPLGLVVAAAAVMGCGFGLSTSFSSRRVLAALADEDRAIGSAALMTVRQIGGAVGAAIAGAVANLVGFTAGLNDATASAAALWVFAASVPLALAGAAAAWRFTGSASAAQLGASASPPAALS